MVHLHTLRWDGMGCAGNSMYFTGGVHTSELDMGHFFVTQPDPTQDFPDPTRCMSVDL